MDKYVSGAGVKILIRENTLLLAEDAGLLGFTAQRKPTKVQLNGRSLFLKEEGGLYQVELPGPGELSITWEGSFA